MIHMGAMNLIEFVALTIVMENTMLKVFVGYITIDLEAERVSMIHMGILNLIEFVALTIAIENIIAMVFVGSITKE